MSFLRFSQILPTCESSGTLIPLYIAENAGRNVISNDFTYNTVYGIGLRILRQVLLADSAEKLIYTKALSGNASTPLGQPYLFSKGMQSIISNFVFSFLCI